ncbi:hypothetical protein [Commensalibacter papalotli (ex Servin-Garciduenas et al. 2014)]|uniref:N-acetyltransferase domain-containing protein n=1 Tax=Commensalibacter papalotli (ex Servin-Garciduenas et al. 2014) TaxID=1208583 RepID=W7E6I9_9PROT|nr:hypothetical protein [Commensalibacter papalotli (ex Servin-Garciduenas et al. 2014)]EUK18736.1 hypothetical protein COMX_03270 [Commensalibacter papalotli (ex Servin-Garciduenas et al. 2014)]
MTVPPAISNDLKVFPVRTAKQLDLFIRLPRLLYSKYSGYVPPLDFEEKALLHPKKSAFFRYGSAQYFLAYKNNEPVGRISAQIDPNALRQWKEPIGLFGALDAIDDAEVVQQLISTAITWLKKHGMEKIRGPYTLNANSQAGAMVEGQNEPPMIAMPWHPQYLVKHIEAAGLFKAMDLVSYQMIMSKEIRQAHKIPSGLKVGSSRLGNITTRKLNMKEISRDGEILRQLYNDAWDDTWGFVPLTPTEMSILIRDLKLMLTPDNYVLVEQNKMPVAVALMIPNIFDLSEEVGPSPSIIGWGKLGYKALRHQFKSARVILLGISHSIRDTAMGALIPSLVIDELFNRGEALSYNMIELGWILESNKAMRNLIERLAPKPCKTHRVFEAQLDCKD